MFLCDFISCLFSATPTFTSHRFYFGIPDCSTSFMVEISCIQFALPLAALTHPCIHSYPIRIFYRWMARWHQKMLTSASWFYHNFYTRYAVCHSCRYLFLIKGNVENKRNFQSLFPSNLRGICCHCNGEVVIIAVISCEANIDADFASRYRCALKYGKPSKSQFIDDNESSIMCCRHKHINTYFYVYGCRWVLSEDDFSHICWL